ncbi:PTS IIA-like nitrogen regulatory protein PtsN [Marinomonas sp. M1K-6]|uniref:PTS IIA-like nitrogen regulatory protein PtsN n=1 Tax=Marinomonas profundi TaxID=2726122 RepID=A0A847R9N6_9GAMM|nr:PTS IIA-like nitrogen regulatory protein PtsN [Marinomonas profundi]NLQ16950.1 PTS IIA-like nitrogen regulatory protein PtsN [Marinomonas profundi]UDV02675.1 PTS IIA-like nitrogen regulatory protein PtsN [Marinomonas profundi]
MSLKTLLKADLVLAKQEIVSKKRVLESIAETAANRLHCNNEEIYDALLGREKLGSTGIGNGIAIPHCRLESANHTAIVVMSLQSPIDFDSIDKRAVDLIFALIVPPNECDQHLASLAQIAELAQSAEALEKLRSAQSNQELFDIFESLI